MKARLVAFYLPQFHPTPENDAWWGKGFTEWTNVTRARPLFPGHYQPHIPADLGFYDLRVPETRLAQAELARDYGIEGFCYWHYWLDGKFLLERPFNEVLASGQPDFPFCLAWANETWSRRWLGEEKEVLYKQTYSPGNDVAHARWLSAAFADPRYIRVCGRPLFVIYRPLDLPDPKRTTDVYRSECVKQGLPEPYLLATDAHCPGVDCRALGFDGTLVFRPQLGVLVGFNDDRPRFSRLKRNLKLGVLSPSLKIYDYATAQRLMLSAVRRHPTVPSVFVGWDNSPRRGRQGVVVTRTTPQAFESTLSAVVQGVLNQPYEERLVFLNAWNEWAEGNHLEPDRKYSRGFLEAVLRINQGRSE